jgi:EAL domain-containing protein (putative c-di-GMP-specific phosphodiesterase class I)
MVDNNGSSAIVQSIITLGKLLHMNIIAEGVESIDQLNSLKELECPQVQGFLFSKPMDSKTATRLLASPVQYASTFLM